MIQHKNICDLIHVCNKVFINENVSVEYVGWNDEDQLELYVRFNGVGVGFFLMYGEGADNCIDVEGNVPYELNDDCLTLKVVEDVMNYLYSK